MSQIDLLISTIKKSLKKEGITYKMLASEVGLSEAAVKRMFSEKNFTINRLSEICEAMGMQLTDLIRIMEKEQVKTDQLNEEQEKQLASDERLLLVAFLVINGYKIDDIMHAYYFTKPEAIHYLAQLDKLKIIELLPNNRIKLIISSKFSWRRNGPIQKFFTEKLQADFLADSFSKKTDKHYFLTAMLSDKNIMELQSQIESLVSDIKVRNLGDFDTPLNEKQIHSILVAMRPWQPNVFNKLRREE